MMEADDDRVAVNERADLRGDLGGYTPRIDSVQLNAKDVIRRFVQSRRLYCNSMMFE